MWSGCIAKACARQHGTGASARGPVAARRGTAKVAAGRRHVHDERRRPTQGARYDPQLMGLVRDADRAGLLHLSVHDCYSDEELWDYLQCLDLSVLPYRFGTHSG